MEGLERYFGENYSNRCLPDIMTKTPATFLDPYMPTIIPDTGADHPKTYVDMTYLKNKIIDEAIH